MMTLLICKKGELKTMDNLLNKPTNELTKSEREYLRIFQRCNGECERLSV